MSFDERVKRFIRGTRGQLRLIGLTYLGAAALAVGLATQRAWFERQAKEKYPEPTKTARERAGEVQAGRSLGTVDASVRDDLYHLWMSEPGTRDLSRLPRALWAADRGWCLERLERTLLAGNPEQRKRAYEFAGATRSLEVLPFLRRAGDREQARGSQETRYAVARAALDLRGRER